MNDHPEQPSVQEELDALQRQAGELITQGKFASSTKLYGELRRRAKDGGSYYHYVIGTFFEMSQANSFMNYEKVRDRAIELIALTEDEERARAIEPSVELALIDHMRYSTAPCAYENLADATGATLGYNSDGMHSCIADGLQVCRQIGKMSCVDCFREYSIEVYSAADDFELALHNCFSVVDKTEGWAERGDRRWLAAMKASRLLMLAGRFSQALEMADRSVALHNAEGVSIKLCSAVESWCHRNTVALAGGFEELPEIPEVTSYPPREEDGSVNHHLRMLQALRATVAGQLDEAASLLIAEDQLTQRCQALSLWFDVRLRLIVVRLLQGKRRQAEALASELDAKAQEASDWLTLRRLNAVMDSSSPSPVAPWGQPAVVSDSPDAASEQSFSPTENAKPADSVTASSDTDDAAAEDASAEPVASEAGKLLTELQERFLGLDFSSETVDDEVRSLAMELFDLQPAQTTDPDDASLAIHLIGVFLPSVTDRLPEVWVWANSHATSHQEHSTTLSVLGGLADRIRRTEEMSERITASRAEQLHRKAISLPPDRANNWYRAGLHFLVEENEGEAERCFARAFRLDRTHSNAASRLADIYNNSDRNRDALMVLDLCLREGTEDSEIAMKAAVAAMNLGQPDAMLTYLDRCEQMTEPSPWTRYYRAVALYDLDRWEECCECVASAVDLQEADSFAFQALRAAARIRQNRADDASADLQAVLATPLYEQTDLAPKGIRTLLGRIYSACQETNPELSDAAEQIWLRLLRSGLIDNHLIDRRTGDACSVRLFHCLVEQPVDDRWKTDPDRLFFQEEWPLYLAVWGVLAADADEAGRIALEWQRRCAPLEPVLIDVADAEQEFEDAPGVVFLGERFPPENNADEESEDGVR
ncbi:MAG: tetratricopeptide repeat protein [Planctomycetaceae bacterium]|nr:tetratricopeptide repeat protein [Planctomycetaceae bacterium]